MASMRRGFARMPPTFFAQRKAPLPLLLGLASASVKPERLTEPKDAVYPAADAIMWARLTDVQRTEVLLESTRLLDQEDFTRTYASYNGPSPDMAFTNTTAPGTKK